MRFQTTCGGAFRFLQNQISASTYCSFVFNNRTAGSIILQISHGYEIAETEDPFVKIADEATEQFSQSTAPGGFIVNLIPACKLPSPSCPGSPLTGSEYHLVRHVPDWFPGTSWKRTAASWADTLARMADGPHQFVKDQMVITTIDVPCADR